LAKKSDSPDLTVVTDETPEPPYIRTKDKVFIIGFAPSWNETPWDDEEADLWGMNALYKADVEMPKRNWRAWFQLHDIKKHHPDDYDEHLKFLTELECPVFLWDKEAEKYPEIDTAVVYPREDMVAFFDSYFTNTVSWMTALALALGYKEIHIYGVDMAQGGEYQNQRPSCEYFIGWGRGMGVKVYIPETSDLLKSPFQYGYDDPSVMRRKMEGRLKELQDRMQSVTAQRDQAMAGVFQLQGAIEDVRYWLTNWVHDDKEQST
jgi:hypothetical protein